jgi:histidyl-tRNA synthetase
MAVPQSLCAARPLGYKAANPNHSFQEDPAFMAKAPASNRPEARTPRGFQDIDPARIRAESRMLATIREVYESYGFEPLETPALEYTDALGKFLPDQDRPNEGVFSFQDEDEQWLSLRYDLTAPLARYVAQGLKSQKLSLPYRRYAVGPVWRNEKPGPGRFRQFTQFDADTVGTDNIAADAEICMLAADTLERLGIARGQYRIKVNNRKVLDGMIQSVGIGLADDAKRLAVMRSLDKLDKFSRDDIALLLGPGRKDASGDFTKGAGLSPDQTEALLAFVTQPSLQQGKAGAIASRKGFDPTPLYEEGLAELGKISELVRAAGYGDDRIAIDFSVVRGLEYYTGPVFEAELTFEVKDEDGNTVRFGSVGGGGRYDGLVERFTGTKVPATGFSIGVSRLASALALLASGSQASYGGDGPVIVLVMDKAELPRYQRMAQTLRQAGIRAEMYLGTAGMKAQMKYADKRRAPCVVIQGSNERDAGEVQIKDLIEGAKAAEAIKDNKEWKAARPAQFSVPETELVAAVRRVIASHS